MPGAVRYVPMFRTAAMLFAFLGVSLLWSYGFTHYRPQFRPYGLAFGVTVLITAAFLFRLERLAIGASAAICAFICLCATVAAPGARGPAILLFAAVALLSGAYAVFAARVLFERSA